MGVLENSARKKRRKGYLQRAVLTTVAISGVILIAMTAPNTLQLLGGVTRKHTRRFPEETRSALSRLAQKGHVNFEASGGKKYARITNSGIRELEREILLNDFQSRTRKRWDGRYRLILFDVSEKRRGARVRLRRNMHSWGFLRLQDSVWVYPHDCEDVVALLKTDLRLGKEVLYAVVESIDNDAWIRKYFHI